MTIRYLLLLSAVLVCSAIVFNLSDRLLTPGSIAISMSMVSLATSDFVLIMYFFKRLHSIEVSNSTQSVNFIACAIVTIFWLVQGLVG